MYRADDFTNLPLHERRRLERSLLKRMRRNERIRRWVIWLALAALVALGWWAAGAAERAPANAIFAEVAHAA